MNRDERIEKARELWIAEMDRVGPDWDTAEVMENYATDREAVLVAALEELRDFQFVAKSWDYQREINQIARVALAKYRGER